MDKNIAMPFVYNDWLSRNFISFYAQLLCCWELWRQLGCHFLGQGILAMVFPSSWFHSAHPLTLDKYSELFPRERRRYTFGKWSVAPCWSCNTFYLGASLPRIQQHFCESVREKEHQRSEMSHGASRIIQMWILILFRYFDTASPLIYCWNFTPRNICALLATRNSLGST